MTLKNRYKSKKNRRFVGFLGFYMMLTFFLLFYNTFARYTTVLQNESTVAIADWQISINDKDILNEQRLVNSLQLIPDTNVTTDNKIAPGQKGYFDIIINPEGTDVAIQYMMNFDTTQIPTGIKLKEYKILENGASAKIENNIIEGEINLEEKKQLTQEEQKTIRVFWEWNEVSTYIPTGEEHYLIQATVIIKQKIS